MTIPPAFLDELRARTSLSSLIQKTVKLTKAGKEYKGCCPFHNEKSPSFYVNDDKGFYHCFGCSVHGDAIRWMTDQRGLPFIDAVKELAAAAGMEVPAQSPQDAARASARDEHLSIMDRAARFYATALHSDRAHLAQGYLRGRGISGDIARHFGMGFAPVETNSGLLEAMRGVALEALEALGLRRVREGQTFDFFRNRLLFPIHDVRGRVIGFGGRAFGDTQPKYLNTPDTPIFDKGRTLFNHHRAAPVARKSERLIIVEGYMDVVGMYRAGIEDVVAPNGTALTDHQMMLAWRLVDAPILCFDGDAAGRKAAARAARAALPLLVPGKTLRFVTPPEGQDPDEIERREGPAAVSRLFDQPRELLDVLWEAETAAHDTSTVDGMAALRGSLRTMLRTIRDEVVGEAYLQGVAERFDRLQSRRAAAPRQNAPRSRARGGELEASVIIGLLRYPAVASRFMDEVAAIEWSDKRSKALADLVTDQLLSGPVTVDKLQVALERAGLADTARDVARYANLPYIFLTPGGGDAAENLLGEVLLRMPRRR